MAAKKTMTMKERIEAAAIEIWELGPHWKFISRRVKRQIIRYVTAGLVADDFIPAKAKGARKAGGK